MKLPNDGSHSPGAPPPRVPPTPPQPPAQQQQGQGGQGDQGDDYGAIDAFLASAEQSYDQFLHNFTQLSAG